MTGIVPPDNPHGDDAALSGAVQPDILDAMRATLRDGDPDRLADLLGLPSAEAAARLRAIPAGLDHLAVRLAEGCAGLTLADAHAHARALLKADGGAQTHD